MFTRFTVFPNQAPFFRELLTDVYRFRRRVFVDGLGWPLTVHSDGGERDNFDNGEAINVALTQDNAIKACARLNPATDCLLTSVFSDIIEEPIKRPDEALECSRFAVDPDLQAKEQRVWSARLLWAVGMAGLAHGTQRFVSLSDPIMERVLRRIGGEPRRLGRPRKSAEGHGVLALELPGDPTAVARVGAHAELPPEHIETLKEIEP